MSIHWEWGFTIVYIVEVVFITKVLSCNLPSNPVLRIVLFSFILFVSIDVIEAPSLLQLILFEFLPAITISIIFQIGSICHLLTKDYRCIFVFIANASESSYLMTKQTFMVFIVVTWLSTYSFATRALLRTDANFSQLFEELDLLLREFPQLLQFFIYRRQFIGKFR